MYDVRTGNVLGSKHCHKAEFRAKHASSFVQMESCEDAAVAVDLHPRTGAMASGGFDGQAERARDHVSVHALY